MNLTGTLIDSTLKAKLTRYTDSVLIEASCEKCSRTKRVPKRKTDTIHTLPPFAVFQVSPAHGIKLTGDNKIPLEVDLKELLTSSNKVGKQVSCSNVEGRYFLLFSFFFTTVFFEETNFLDYFVNPLLQKDPPSILCVVYYVTSNT